MTSYSDSDVSVDFSALCRLANERFGKTVDWDLRGEPITDCSVLMWGAYGPAVMRLVTLAVKTQHQNVDKDQLIQLAAEAFGQGLDRDFAGNILTHYDIVLEDSYGFGETVLALVNLAINEREQLSRICA